MARVSVIIPVYINTESVFELFLKSAASILGQTCRDMEIILVINGTKKTILDNIVGWAAKDRRLKIYNIKEERGATKAMNFGFGVSCGEYVCFHDQDDVSDVRRFEEQIKYLNESGDDIVASNILVIDGKKNRLKGFDQKTIIDKFIKRDLIKSPAHFGSLMMRRGVVKEMGGFENVLTADSIFCIKLNLLRYFGENKMLHVIKKPLFSWVRHSGSNTYNKRSVFVESANTERKKILLRKERIVSSTNRDDLKEALEIKNNFSLVEKIVVENLK